MAGESVQQQDQARDYALRHRDGPLTVDVVVAQILREAARGGRPARFDRRRFGASSRAYACRATTLLGAYRSPA